MIHIPYDHKYFHLQNAKSCPLPSEYNLKTPLDNLSTNSGQLPQIYSIRPNVFIV